MKLIPIDLFIPARPKLVLLFGREPFSKRPHWSIGRLGGCQNAPEFAATSTNELAGHSITIRATHWAELKTPDNED